MPSVIPAQHFCDNLVWTDTGQVMATWSLSPLPKPQTETESQLAEIAHSTLYRSLSGHQAMLQGLLTWTDPVSIVERMLAGVDLVQNPAWIAEVDATIDLLADQSLGQRRWYLTTSITPSPRWRVQTTLRSGLNSVLTSLGIAGEPPGPAEIEAYQIAARRLAARLPSVFDARPVTRAEHIWVHRHTLLRHDLGEIDPQQAPELAEELVAKAGRAAIGNFVLDPMALSDVPGGLKGAAARIKAPFTRRTLKVITGTGDQSYQSSVLVADTPITGLRYPDYQFLSRVDDTGVPSDILIHLTSRPRGEAIRLNKRAMNQLNDQLGQVGEDNSDQASHLIRLYDAAAILEDYNLQISRDAKEVETEQVIALTTAGASFEEADRRAAEMVKHPVFDRLTLERPPGGDEKVFWASFPGSKPDRQLSDYRHIATGADAATALPITSTELGTDTGFLLGVNKTSGLRSAVLMDLFGDAKRGVSPAFIVGGELGAGKSKTMKKICGHCVDRGGRMIGTDNSTTREWMTWAQSLAAADSGITVSLCDVAAPETSIDPLRVLPPKLAGKVMQDFLIVLLNIEAQERTGQTVAKVLKPGYLQEHKIDSAGALHRHLATSAAFAGAAELAERIDVFADPERAGSLASAVFDPDLPALDLDARAVIIGTSSVDIPDDKEVELAHLYRVLSVTKIFGRALWALIASLGYKVCFADPSMDSLFSIDEFHHLRSSREALESASKFIRYGRRTKAALIAGTHDPMHDFDDDTLRGLIKNRLMMRNTDPNIAERCAEFLVSKDKHPDEHEALVSRIMGHSPVDDREGSVLPERLGEGTLMDARRRIGDIQVLHEAQEHRNQASNTTPPDRARL